TVGIEIVDGHAARLLEMVVGVGSPVNRPGLDGDGEVGSNRATVADQERLDALRGIAGYGEADALRHGDDGGVDADHLTTRVNQRTAGVAGIEGRVGLNDVLDGAAPLGPHGAT